MMMCGVVSVVHVSRRKLSVDEWIFSPKRFGGNENVCGVTFARIQIIPAWFSVSATHMNNNSILELVTLASSGSYIDG